MTGSTNANSMAATPDRLHASLPTKVGGFSTIFKGVIPFVVTDIVRLIILIAFPLLATWLPQHMMAR